MKLTQEEKAVIIKSKTEKFKDYEMITNELIIDLVDRFEKEKFTVLGQNVIVSEGNEGLAYNLVVSMKIDEIIYYYLSRKAAKNDDLLLQLTFDKQHIIKRGEKLLKGNFCDKDDALMEGILSYPGYFSFDIWILHYVKCKVNGIPMDLVKPEEKENNLVLTKKRKQK